MVQLTLKLRVNPGCVSDVTHALRVVLLAAQWHRGWVRAQAYRDLGDPDTLHYVEEWLTCEDAAREIRSARFGRLLELMEAAAEPPDLQFQFITGVRGLDYVAEVRGDQRLGNA
jgi:quinol monooxygenase YgiN